MGPSPPQIPPPLKAPRERVSFGEDFRRFFVKGMAAILPTLITLWLLVKVWDFLWEALGQHIIYTIGVIWHGIGDQPYGFIKRYWETHPVLERCLGVLLAVLLVYIVGVVVGNFIGRTFYRLAETAVMRIPLVRAIYPAVKQVTDFLLTKRNTGQFAGSHVVAVQPHEQAIWSIGLVTGGGLKALSDAVGEDMVSVFVPSTPTAFSGYVLVVPRRNVVELPLTVEEAMRLLISGGVIVPDGDTAQSAAQASPPSTSAPARLPLAG